MPQFRFRAMTTYGEIVSGEVDAPSRDEMIKRVEYLGHLLIDADIAPKSGFLSAGKSTAGERLKPSDVTLFLRQLALLIGAGLTLEAAHDGFATGAALPMPAGTDHLRPPAVRMLRVGMDRLMGVIGPATIVAVSLTVGTLIVSIMSALLSITELAL
jgi:general secretion pathway protein F